LQQHSAYCAPVPDVRDVEGFQPQRLWRPLEVQLEGVQGPEIEVFMHLDAHVGALLLPGLEIVFVGA
jgi:hypothetical protein